MAEEKRVLTPEEIAELDAASARVAAGNAGKPSSTNAGDVANIKYATDNLGYAYTPPVGGVDVTPAPTPESGGNITNDDNGINEDDGKTPEERAEEMLGGEFSSSQSAESIAEQEARRREQVRQQANALFDPRINRAKRIGENQVGTAEGASGQRAGFNLSTAESTFINSVQAEVNTRIDEIQQSKAAFIANGDFQAAERADASLEKLEDRKTQFMLNKANLAMQIMAGDRSETQLDLQLAATLAALPAGQTVEIDGKTYEGMAEPDPFFSGSDVAGLMATVKEGETINLEDPSTGDTYKINGIASPDPDLYMTKATNNNGDVTVTAYNKSDGKVAWQAKEAGVGPSRVGDGSEDNPKLSGLFDEANKELQASIVKEGDYGWNPNEPGMGKMDTELYNKWRRKYMEADPIRGMDQFLVDFPLANLNLETDKSAIDFVEALEDTGQKADSVEGDEVSEVTKLQAAAAGFLKPDGSPDTSAYATWVSGGKKTDAAGNPIR